AHPETGRMRLKDLVWVVLGHGHRQGRVLIRARRSERGRLRQRPRPRLRCFAERAMSAPRLVRARQGAVTAALPGLWVEGILERLPAHRREEAPGGAQCLVARLDLVVG